MAWMTPSTWWPSAALLGSMPMREPRGTLCFVLHSHLPWLSQHGTWPVGEEWLHQAWSQSYVPLVAMLQRLAAEGRTELLSLGITPVLAAQLDDPTLLREHHTWLGFWQLRADALADARDGSLRELGQYEARRAREGRARFEADWASGGSAPLRALADAGAVELLGGPATHPVLPLVQPRVADCALHAGLADHTVRFGARPAGVWSPECAYTPGLEGLLARHGVEHLMLDGPTLQHVGASTGLGRRLGGSDVVVFGRDLEVTYRVWSPRRGYPGGPWYRDFHTHHHASGFKPSRVTGGHVAPEHKAPYDPSAARAAIADDVADFVATVVDRLEEVAAREGRPGLVVAGYDTELFGHWWHEGVDWLEGVLRALPEAGVQLATMGGAVGQGLVAGRVAPEAGTWGLGKDFHIWAGDAVKDLLVVHDHVQADLLEIVDRRPPTVGRDPDLDVLARHALLTVASDWPFMVSHDSAADYARSRVDDHAQSYWQAAEAVRRGASVPAAVARRDVLLGHLDARRLHTRF
jgi:1,4-alpha-glucan branching enzyme